jgi:UDP-N-acetylglucosamine--N-acetylmuramyl-(pentapeptide) pyrophosphoryl-undecaprenol N-acetylglucosamine transferase
MRLALTGGGTGGHVFPAIETGLAARSRGWDVSYYGSLRGMEESACRKEGFSFQGYNSGPIYRVASLKGLKGLFDLFMASRKAASDLSKLRPDVVFSTGGYSSAPVVMATSRLKIPLVIHEQNSAPGRTNLRAARSAACVCTVFQSAESHFPGVKVVRTGMPIRATLREGSHGDLPFHEGVEDDRKVVLVMGGSQGAAALNDIALTTAMRMAGSGVRWIHLTGVKHFEAAMAAREKLPVEQDYDIQAFLDAEGMRWALGAASLAVCRSGAGTISELAAYRIPAIFVPFPNSYADHQTKNAKEIADLGGGALIPQDRLEPVSLEGAILSWVTNPAKCLSAQKALSGWDIVESVSRILNELELASRSKA